MSIEVLCQSRTVIGEGPHYSVADDGNGILYYIDILGFKICRYDTGNKLNKMIEVCILPVSFLVLRRKVILVFYFRFPVAFLSPSSSPYLAPVEQSL
jgi:sugar lactone lactonase YvrE